MYRYVLPNLEATKCFAKRMAYRLQKGGIVFLSGDLGSGKTALTKFVVSFLDKKIKIKSPTYALRQDYLLANGQKLLHLDLYRLADFDEVYHLGYEEMFLDKNQIVMIEWSERIPDTQRPANYLNVFLEAEEGEKRILKLDIVRSDILQEQQIEDFLNEFQTPENVRRHSGLVARVAKKLGEALVLAGEIVDVRLLYEAAMLHDLVRVVDFRELKKEKMLENITDLKWRKWQELRKRFKGKSHAQAAQEILQKRGYRAVADVIRKHCTSCILGLNGKNELVTWEDKLLYYADKRVKHEQIVDLETRFRIGRTENGHLLKSLAESIEIEARANELEREIATKIGMNFLRNLAD